MSAPLWFSLWIIGVSVTLLIFIPVAHRKYAPDPECGLPVEAVFGLIGTALLWPLTWTLIGLMLWNERSGR